MSKKKQQIILTHGSAFPGDEAKKGLKLGEVLVQHAAEAKDAALHTAIKEATETEEAVLVSFPSKEWVEDKIDKVNAEGINQTITGLQERLTTAEGEIDALQQADINMEAAYKAADDVVRGEFAAADKALETAYKAADSALETAYKAADSALAERITAVEGTYVKNVVANGVTYSPENNVLDLSALVIDGGEY
jgi:hypothetical protein